MTIGGYIDWQGVPILFCDTLITGVDADVPPGQNFAKEFKKQLATFGFKYTGLVRKLVDVTPTLSFCWAGRVVEAANFKREITVAASKTGFDEDAFVKFINSYPAEDAKGLEIIALLVGDKKHTVAFINTASYDLDGTTVAIIGSGRSTLHKIVQTWIPNVRQPFHPKTLSWLVSDLYHSVVVSGLGSNLAWGGGFESRYGTRGKICRIDQVCSSVFVPRGHVYNQKSQYVHFYVGEWAFFMCNGTPMAALPIDYMHESVSNIAIAFVPQFVFIGFAFGRGGFTTIPIADHVPKIAGSPPQIGNKFAFVYTEEAMTYASMEMRRNFPEWAKARDASSPINVLAMPGPAEKQ